MQASENRRRGRPSKSQWTWFASLRESRGMTQVELADTASMQQTQISRIERGETAPDLPQMRRLSEALRIPSDVLASEAIKFFAAA